LEAWIGVDPTYDAKDWSPCIIMFGSGGGVAAAAGGGFGCLGGTRMNGLCSVLKPLERPKPAVEPPNRGSECSARFWARLNCLRMTPACRWHCRCRGLRDAGRVGEIWRGQLRTENYRLVIVPAEPIRRRRFATGARSLADLGAPDLCPERSATIFGSRPCATTRGFPPYNYCPLWFPGKVRLPSRAADGTAKARNPSSVQSE